MKLEIRIRRSQEPLDVRRLTRVAVSILVKEETTVTGCEQPRDDGRKDESAHKTHSSPSPDVE